MSLIKYNPVTSSQRQLVLVDRKSLWKGKPCAKLVKGKNSKGGRNNLGRITVFGKSAGAKKRIRFVDFKRFVALDGVVERLEYDPNRTAYIALVKYSDGQYSYIIAPEGLKKGDIVVSSNDAAIKVGNC